MGIKVRSEIKKTYCSAGRACGTWWRARVDKAEQEFFVSMNAWRDKVVVEKTLEHSVVKALSRREERASYADQIARLFCLNSAL